MINCIILYPYWLTKGEGSMSTNTHYYSCHGTCKYQTTNNKRYNINALLSSLPLLSLIVTSFILIMALAI